jgi:hypothetical protein
MAFFVNPLAQKMSAVLSIEDQNYVHRIPGYLEEEKEQHLEDAKADTPQSVECSTTAGSKNARVPFMTALFILVGCQARLPEGHTANAGVALQRPLEGRTPPEDLLCNIGHCCTISEG